jgi:hypothetical protein
MKLKVEDFGKYTCNVTNLERLLNVTSTKVSLWDISNALCNIGEEKAVAMVESMLQNMEIGRLVQEVMIYCVYTEASQNRPLRKQAPSLCKGSLTKSATPLK